MGQTRNQPISTPIRRNSSMRTLSALLIVGAVLATHGCHRSDAQRAVPSARPHAWSERVKSITPQELQARGPGLEQTPSGISTRLIHKGRGKRRATNLDAIVLYSQTYDTSGVVSASGSQLIGNPAVDLTKGGQEAIQMMVEGDVRRFWFADPKEPDRFKVTDYELLWISPDED
jgi:hypothetical protein